MLLAIEDLSAFQVLVNTLSMKSKAEISTGYVRIHVARSILSI